MDEKLNYELEALLERIYNAGNEQGFIVSFAEWFSGKTREDILAKINELVRDGQAGA